MRIVFMGTPDYATTILKEILQNRGFKVVAVVTQPDKPVGRKQILTPPNVKKFLLDDGYDTLIYQPNDLNDEKFIKKIKDLNLDFIVVAAYGKILPKKILDICPSINLHASLLPKYRGASPIQNCLLNGDSITGVTAMLMDEGLDTGDILGFIITKIKKDDNAVTLFKKLSIMAAKLTIYVLENFNSIKALRQNSVDATYCKKIEKEDGRVDFLDARAIFNKYRAFISWPGIYLKSGLKLKKIDLIDTFSKNKEGKILEFTNRGVIIGCKKGKIEIIEVQPPSKRVMDIFSFLRGRRLGIGDYLS